MKDLQYCIDNRCMIPSDVKAQIFALTPKCTGNLRERLYWLRNGLTDYPNCEHCNSLLTSRNFINNGKAGYRKYCSIKCKKRDQDYSESIAKRTETNLKRYGSSSPWHFENYRVFVKEKYGLEMIEEENDV